jgi:hypothetical protein
LQDKSAQAGGSEAQRKRFLLKITIINSMLVRILLLHYGLLRRFYRARRIYLNLLIAASIRLGFKARNTACTLAHELDLF